jgi:DNA topoisomerase-1
VELQNAEGTFLVCPNNHDAMPKRRPRKGAKVEEAAPTHPPCSFERKIGPPKPKEAVPERVVPDAAKTRPVVEAVA